MKASSGISLEQIFTKLLIRKTEIIVRFFIFWLALISTVFACKYTVRDIGFSDLGLAGYRLYFYIDDDTPAKIITGFENIAYAAFLDANIKTQIIHIKKQAGLPEMSYLKSHQLPTMPALILVSPDERTLLLPLVNTQLNVNQAVWRLCENVASSPLREKIIPLLTDSYGVVLMIEGKNKEKNHLAEDQISQAVKNIEQVLSLMPKPIDKPPQVISVPEQTFYEEKVLFWSMGIISGRAEETQVIVLYGRGRWIGPVLRGVEINSRNIFNILTIIGADCECGLDRSLLLGKPIPLRWNKKVQEDLRARLGFDVENPLIKSEIHQILSASRVLNDNNALPDPLTVYGEGVIDFEHVTPVPSVSSAPFRQKNPADSDSNDTYAFRVSLYSLSGLLFLILLGGVYIFFRSRRRQKF
jgi:hypothetical protein